MNDLREQLKNKGFELALETDKYIFYCKFDECDNNGNTIMFNKNMELISDNYFASVGMDEELEEKYNKNNNKDITYIHDDIIYYMENKEE